MTTLIARACSIVLLPAAILCGAGSTLAAEGGAPMDTWPVDRSRNQASLQNGARLFANYCIGCHSATLVRWNRLQELGLTDAQIQQYLIFGNQKIGDAIRSPSTAAEQKRWFGKTPPDLSVITRARTSFDHAGTDYIYTLLRGYYRDASSPTGWNNVAYPNIAMPHVFWQEQGPREARIEFTETRKDPKTAAAQYFNVVTTYEPNGASSRVETPIANHGAEGINYAFRPLNVEQSRRFDSDAADLVAFLAFITDPTAGKRVQIGVWVLIFLSLFTVIAWRLNAVYWKNIK
ncbi:MAG: cytochrome c1 [Pseudomonadota bacterium]|nr:cytochrome c1 [Pseudomonadota bacterium]